MRQADWIVLFVLSLLFSRSFSLSYPLHAQPHSSLNPLFIMSANLLNERPNVVPLMQFLEWMKMRFVSYYRSKSSADMPQTEVPHFTWVLHFSFKYKRGHPFRNL
jgi:hypothetical protein